MSLRLEFGLWTFELMLEQGEDISNTGDKVTVFYIVTKTWILMTRDRMLWDIV